MMNTVEYAIHIINSKERNYYACRRDFIADIFGGRNVLGIISIYVLILAKQLFF